MNDEIFNRNLNALRRHPNAFSVVKMAAGQYRSDFYAVETAKNGQLTMSFCEASQRPVSYHSRYNPLSEAEKQVQAGYNGQTHVMLLGFGLGYMAEYLLQQLNQRVSGPQLFIIEPDPGVFLTALKSRDLVGFLNDGRVALCVGLNADQIGDFWSTNLDWTALECLAVIDHSPSVARFRAYFERVIEKIRYLCNRSKGNLVTLMHAGFEFHTNYFSNLAASFGLPGVERLFDRFKGVPAVVVAAGPSLDKNMHLLKTVKGRFPIVAVDTALRQLVANGIKPDIVCAADPSYENSLDFVGVENETEVVLAVEPMTHPDIFSSFKGPLMLMTFGGGLQPVIQDLREPVGTLGCWGSIATTNFDLVRKMGADPIIFLGLDLSFQDGRLHARGSYSDDIFYEKVHQFTSIEHETADYINTRGTFKFGRADGSILYTDQNMKLYKDWFEDQFRQTAAHVINATEGGVVDKYVEIMPFARVIEKYSGQSAPVREIIADALARPVKADRDALLAKLAQFKKTLRQNESAARRAVSVCRRLLGSHAATVASRLEGKARAEFFDVMILHDKICSDKELFPWLSVHQTRFITRHTMEVTNLKGNSDTTVGQWFQQTLEFFAALEKFHEYQMPLLDQAMESLTRQIKSNTVREGAAS